MIKELFNNMVAIEPEKPKEKTASGLLIVEQIKTYPPFGTVKAVAKGVTDVKPGDRVLFSVYAGLDVEKDLVLVPLANIMGIVDKKYERDDTK